MSAKSEFLIEDGYTAHKLIETQPGMHGEVHLAYRPALQAEKTSYTRASMISAEANHKADVDLIRKHVVTFNGGALPEPVERLWPPLFARIRDLILSYEPADQRADAKN